MFKQGIASWSLDWEAAWRKRIATGSDSKGRIGTRGHARTHEACDDRRMFVPLYGQHESGRHETGRP